MRHFAHNIGDYAAATAHLTFVEDAAYHRLLRRYYQDEKPLPVDPAECQRLIGARTKEEKAAVRQILQEFFTLGDDGWHQSRADKEIATFHQKVEAARANGTKGGRPANRRKTEPVISANQPENLPTPHYPLPNSVPNGTAACAAVDPVKALFDAGVKLLTAADQPASKAREMVGKWRRDHGDEAVMAAIGAANIAKVSEPIAWVTQYLANHAKPDARRVFETYEQARIRRGRELLAQ